MFNRWREDVGFSSGSLIFNFVSFPPKVMLVGALVFGSLCALLAPLEIDCSCAELAFSCSLFSFDLGVICPTGRLSDGDVEVS